MHADIAILNGNIVTMNKDLLAEAVAIKGDRIIFVGSDNAVKKYINEETLIIDADGKTVLPGLIDCHMHLAGLGFSLQSIDLRNIKSIEELKKKVGEKIDEVKPGKWILGRGWDQELFIEKRYPNRWDLDEVAPNNPVLLTRICGHVIVVNSLALKKAGIDKNTPNPKGGVIERNRNGEPTGILKENALNLVWKAVPEYSLADYEKAVEIACREVVKYGITTLHAMSVIDKEFRAMQNLYHKGRLKTKIRIYFSKNYARDLFLLGIHCGFGNDMIKIMGVKVLLDGSLGGRTAALRQNYSDKSSKRGRILLSDKELFNIIYNTINNNLQISIHAIGDRAIEKVLNILEKMDFNNRLIRIEHASLISRDLLEKMIKLKPYIVIQPHFIITDWWAVDRVGVERSRWIYAFKSMIDGGLILAGSSDSPVEPINPWTGIYAAITRGKYEKIKLYKYTVNERLSLIEALKLYTINASKISFEEKYIGSIEFGKIADLTILNKNIFKISEKELLDIKAQYTIINGKIVYGAK